MIVEEREVTNVDDALLNEFRYNVNGPVVPNVVPNADPLAPNAAPIIMQRDHADSLIGLIRVMRSMRNERDHFDLQAALVEYLWEWRGLH